MSSMIDDRLVAARKAALATPDATDHVQDVQPTQELAATVQAQHEASVTQDQQKHEEAMRAIHNAVSVESRPFSFVIKPAPPPAPVLIGNVPIVLHPASFAIEVTGGGLISLQRQAQQQERDRWHEIVTAAVDATANSEAHQKRDRLAEQLADSERLLAEARQAKAQAEQDVTAALADGIDPAKAEKKIRAAEADIATYEARLEPLAGYLARATDVAKSVEARAEREAINRLKAEQAQRRKAAEKELAGLLLPWIRRALSEL